ncbi:hypothetical protein ACWDYH_30815 [Nocardia goodfellowii]
MMRSVEITAALTGPIDREHRSRLYWERLIELSLDCFICERAGRTTILKYGAERAICSGDTEHGQHFSAARISSFDHTHGSERIVLRSIVDFWWAPFDDTKRDLQAVAPTKTPWVRLHLGYSCPHKDEAGKESIQTNLVRPYELTCAHCETVIAVNEESPAIRLLA